MPPLDTLRGHIVAACPDLADSAFTLLGLGWDSLAVDVDDRLIFKFPRHAAAAARLAREVAVLAIVRPAVTLPVPAPVLHRGPPMFTRHDKLPGEHLLTAGYRTLPDAARDRLAADLAAFYAQLHRIDPALPMSVGAGPVGAWQPPEAILRRTWPVLPPALRGFAEATVAAWEALPPDPHGTVFGFFDGHGWNMAFDHARGRLNGLYDFADSGFGPLHREFVYSNWIDRDLTARIADRYQRLTGRALDRKRIELLSGVLRLSELAEYADDPQQAPAMLRIVADWAAG